MDKVIKKVLESIEEQDYKAYIIGGFVRDTLLKKKTVDVDICTNATPKELLNIFPGATTVPEYGAVKLNIKKYKFDITTFRKESEYINGRPTGIIYVDTLGEDIRRRDFTINSMCFDSKGKLIDPLNGKNDLDNGLIKVVGEVNRKFEEDPSRILRALRFNATLDFKLDADIEEYLLDNKSILTKISPKKKKDEFDKILASPRIFDFISLVKKYDLESALGIKFKKIIRTNLIGMYSQIEFDDKFPFTKVEKDQISSIRKLILKNSIDKFDVYRCGSFIATTAATILGINAKKINKIYEKLAIKDIIEIDIEAKDICEELNIEPSKELGDIYKMLEEEIILGKLENKKELIIKRLNKIKGE